MSHEEKSRNTVFSLKIESSICEEIPSEDNPYLTQKMRCYGYDVMELAQKVSVTQMLYLLFSGELPTSEQHELLEKWWILSMNPGPRHPAVRASMNVSISKTHASHMLPIGLSVMGGKHLGAFEVKEAMEFIRSNLHLEAETVALDLLKKIDTSEEGDVRLAPGFGTLYGGRDPVSRQSAHFLSQLKGAGAAMKWTKKFDEAIGNYKYGILSPGLAAAVFLDLEFDEYHSVGLFQFFTAPGILAHGNEMIGKPLTSMPFPKDDEYIMDGK